MRVGNTPETRVWLDYLRCEKPVFVTNLSLLPSDAYLLKNREGVSGLCINIKQGQTISGESSNCVNGTWERTVPIIGNSLSIIDYRSATVNAYQQIRKEYAKSFSRFFSILNWPAKLSFRVKQKFINKILKKDGIDREIVREGLYYYFVVLESLLTSDKSSRWLFGNYCLQSLDCAFQVPEDRNSSRFCCISPRSGIGELGKSFWITALTADLESMVIEKVDGKGISMEEITVGSKVTKMNDQPRQYV